MQPSAQSSVQLRLCRDTVPSLPSAVEPRVGTLTRGHVGKVELRGLEDPRTRGPEGHARVSSIEYGVVPHFRLRVAAPGGRWRDATTTRGPEDTRARMIVASYLVVGARRCRDLEERVMGRTRRRRVPTWRQLGQHAALTLPSAAEPRVGTLTRGHVGKGVLLVDRLKSWPVGQGNNYGGQNASAPFHRYSCPRVPEKVSWRRGRDWLRCAPGLRPDPADRLFARRAHRPPGSHPFGRMHRPRVTVTRVHVSPKKYPGGGEGIRTPGTLRFI